MSNAQYVPSTSDRMWAYIIDELFVLVLSAPVYLVALRSLSEEGEVVLHWTYALYYGLVRLAYEFCSYYFYQQTPGKWIFGLFLVNAKNPDWELSAWQILTRIFMTKLSFFFSWAPYALALFRYDRRHLADWVAGTRVAAIEKRVVPTRIRWLLASLCILIFVPLGLGSAIEKLNSIEYEHSYFYINTSDESDED